MRKLLKSALLTATVVALGLTSSLAIADPSAADLMKKYDNIMGPANFQAVTLMSAHRDDGTTRAYKMEVLKKGSEHFLVNFSEPAAVKGQQMLRSGDNLWVYMPSLKRAVRLANRDSFQGGDFNNADVLRVNYEADYAGSVTADPARPDAHVLELKAKTTNASYDKIKLWMRKADLLPVKGEYYTVSGKMLRMAEFSDFRDFGGIKRPGKIVMKNMLATQRYSTMQWESFDPKYDPPSTKFSLDNLGK